MLRAGAGAPATEAQLDELREVLRAPLFFGSTTKNQNHPTLPDRTEVLSGALIFGQVLFAAHNRQCHTSTNV